MDAYLFIEGPDFIPFHGDHSSRATLSNDKLLQTLDCHTTPHNSTYCWEARIIPITTLVIRHTKLFYYNKDFGV